MAEQLRDTETQTSIPIPPFWKNKQFLTILSLIIFTTVNVLIGINLIDWSKVYFYTKILTSFYIFFIPIILLAVIIIAISRLPSGISKLSDKELKEISTIKDTKTILTIFKYIPENCVRVIKNAFSSNPKTGKGYVEKREGWSGRIPFLQEEVALVSLVPSQKDPKPIEVNTKDNILPVIDFTYESMVAYSQKELTNGEIKAKKRKDGIYNVPIRNAAIKYATKVKSQEREKIEKQHCHNALNMITASYNCSGDNGLTELDKKGIKKLGHDATELACKALEEYGLRLRISIKTIRLPRKMEAAAADKEAADMRLDAAEAETQILEKKIARTKANPNVAMITEAIFRIAGDRSGAGEQKPYEDIINTVKDALLGEAGGDK